METEQSTDIAIAPNAAAEVMKANEKPAQPTKETWTVKTEPSELKVDQKPEKQSKSDKPWKATDLSPEQQKLFNGMWRTHKNHEREIAELRDIAKQQFEVISTFEKRQGEVIGHLHAKDFESAESKLKQARKEARARGDEDAVDDINDQLSEIKAKRIAAANQPKQQQVQQQASQQRPRSASEAANYAASQGQLSTEEQRLIQVWQEEADDMGEPLRPWASDSDPRYPVAVAEAKIVFNSPIFAAKTPEERLAEIDRRMGLKPREVEQQVLSSRSSGSSHLTRLNGKGNNRNVQLSERAERTAVANKFAGPGKSAQEHIEAYRAQVAKFRGGLQ